MLSNEAASELNVQGLIPKPLINASFAEGTHLWKKERHFKGFNGDELTAPRYSYTKMGKTLGLETTRYLAQWMGHLFYFNDNGVDDYLGYCQLQNVYVQWLPLKCGRFLLVLSNGYQTSHFFFAQATFWQNEQVNITKYGVQLDFAEKYHIKDLLGQGSYSQVHKVHSKTTGECCAAKVINKVDKKEMPTKEMASSQRKILNIMKEEKGVSKFHQFYETEDSYVIIMDYIDGHSMMHAYQSKKEFELPKMKELFVDILSTIKECHSKNIIHRDIKPHNIILTNQTLEPKLIDFGLALITNHQMENCNYYKCGTSGYIAPEVLINDSMFYKSYGYKCDIFSFGVVAHMFLMGNNPLSKQQEQQNCKNMMIQLDQKNIVEKYGDHCYTFLNKLMATNPKQRYTAQEALKSSFLKDCFDREESMSTVESFCYTSRDFRDFD